MKYLLSLVLCITGLAQSLDDPGFVGSLSPLSSTSTTYLVKEDCDGTGTPSGWTDNGTPDWDFTPGLVGTQSLRITGDGATAEYSTAPTFTAIDEVWGYFIIKVVSAPSVTRFIATFRDGTSSRGLFYATFSSASEFYFTAQAGGGSSVSTVAKGTYGNVYHVWIYAKKGSGANGIATIAFSSDGTKPVSGDNYAESTNGTFTQQLDRFRIGSGLAETEEIIVDKMRVNNVNIPSNPD